MPVDLPPSNQKSGWRDGYITGHCLTGACGKCVQCHCECHRLKAVRRMHDKNLRPGAGWRGVVK